MTIGGAPEDADRIKRFRDLGAVRVNVTLPAEGADQILPVLDRWAKLIRPAAIGRRPTGRLILHGSYAEMILRIDRNAVR